MASLRTTRKAKNVGRELRRLAKKADPTLLLALEELKENQNRDFVTFRNPLSNVNPSTNESRAVKNLVKEVSDRWNCAGIFIFQCDYEFET